MAQARRRRGHMSSATTLTSGEADMKEAKRKQIPMTGIYFGKPLQSVPLVEYCDSQFKAENFERRVKRTSHQAPHVTRDTLGMSPLQFSRSGARVTAQASRRYIRPLLHIRSSPPLLPSYIKMSSRFFHGGDSDSESSSSEEEELYGEQAAESEEESEEEDEDEEDSDEESSEDEGRGTGASRFLKPSGGGGDDSDESEDEDREKVVKSAKDKRFEELEGTVKAIENAQKIGDWAVISTGRCPVCSCLMVLA